MSFLLPGSYRTGPWSYRNCLGDQRRREAALVHLYAALSPSMDQIQHLWAENRMASMPGADSFRALSPTRLLLMGLKARVASGVGRLREVVWELFYCACLGTYLRAQVVYGDLMFACGGTTLHCCAHLS